MGPGSRYLFSQRARLSAASLSPCTPAGAGMCSENEDRAASGQPVSGSGRQRGSGTPTCLGSTGTPGSTPLNQEPASWKPITHIPLWLREPTGAAGWVALPAGLAGSGEAGHFDASHAHTPEEVAHVPMCLTLDAHTPKYKRLSTSHAPWVRHRVSNISLRQLAWQTCPALRFHAARDSLTETQVFPLRRQPE